MSSKSSTLYYILFHSNQQMDFGKYDVYLDKTISINLDVQLGTLVRLTIWIPHKFKSHEAKVVTLSYFENQCIPEVKEKKWGKKEINFFAHSRHTAHKMTCLLMILVQVTCINFISYNARYSLDTGWVAVELLVGHISCALHGGLSRSHCTEAPKSQ